MVRQFYVWTFKVYTVNQESAYLVVQGVPALGTSQELIQLFAVYGAVQEYRILDEFPTADKYNDVYLIKFQKSRQQGCKPIFWKHWIIIDFGKKYWLVINFVSVSHLHVL